MKLPVSLLRGAASLLSPPGRRAKLVVLAYHRILSAPDPLLPDEIDVTRFRIQLDALRAHFNVLRLDEAMQGMLTGNLPARAVCITFDDGYLSNASLGLPILQEYGFPATFFIATGFLNGGRMFNDTVIEAVRRLDNGTDLSPLGLDRAALDTPARRAALVVRILDKIKYLQPDERDEWTQRLAGQLATPLPNDLMMSDSDVAALAAAGMEIGAHTVNHPILSRLTDAQAREEIIAGRDRLQVITGASIDSFAYPNGRPGTDYGATHVRIVAEAGFKLAVTTAWGVARRNGDRYQVPRIGSWDRSTQRFVLRLLRACTQPAAATV